MIHLNCRGCEDFRSEVYFVAAQLQAIGVQIGTRQLSLDQVRDALDKVRVRASLAVQRDPPVLHQSFEDTLSPLEDEIESAHTELVAMRRENPHSAMAVAQVLEKIVDRLRAGKLPETELRWLLLLTAGILRGCLVV